MKRILVIEDDDQIRLLLRKILEKAGYQVTEAQDGYVGLRLFRSQPADLVITDIFMPEKEGLGTIRELKRDFPGVKIIAISGGGLTGNLSFLQVAGAMGAQRTIVKPFDYMEILTAVKEVLRSN